MRRAARFGSEASALRSEFSASAFLPEFRQQQAAVEVGGGVVRARGAAPDPARARHRPCARPGCMPSRRSPAFRRCRAAAGWPSRMTGWPGPAGPGPCRSCQGWCDWRNRPASHCRKRSTRRLPSGPIPVAPRAVRPSARPPGMRRSGCGPDGTRPPWREPAPREFRARSRPPGEPAAAARTSGFGCCSACRTTGSRRGSSQVRRSRISDA